MTTRTTKGRRRVRPEGVFRALLRLFPFEFRRDYGREMTLVFHDQCRDAAEENDTMSWIRLWWETFAGIFRTAPGEHLAMLRQDLGYASRALSKNPGFAAVALVTLALGIGVNTAIFTLIDGVLLRPLAYPRADRLVWVGTVQPEKGWRSVASLHDFEDWRAQSDSFEHLAVFSPRSANLSAGGTAKRVSYALVSSEFFSVVGVAPELGRGFHEGEDLPGADGVVVLSHGFWQTTLGAAPDALGTHVELDGRRLEVVGVMPAGFDFLPGGTELWKPLGMTPDQTGTRGGRWIPAIGRLKPDVTLETAQTEMAGLAARLAAAYPETNEGWEVRLEPLHERIVGGARSALYLVWAAVGVVLLIVCANLANLLLARGTARRQEIALRSVLGAGRGRLVRQLLSESLLLALAGGLVGLLLAAALVRLLPALAAGWVPRIEDVGLDARILVFTLGLSLLTGVLFGLMPAFRLSRGDLNVALKDSDPDGADRRGALFGGRGVRGSLVVAEVALALVVLVAAGLLVQSFAHLLDVDPGFESRGVVTLRVAPPKLYRPEDRLTDEAIRKLGEERSRISAFYRQLLGRIEAIPGVGSAGAVNQRPLSGFNAWRTGYRIEGRGDTTVDGNARTVTPGYFETLGIALRRGRLFEPADDADSLRVVVINQAMADAYWPDSDPIGRRLAIDGDVDGWSTIVGIVETVRDSRLERAANPMVYWTLPQARWGHFMDWGMYLVVRADGDPTALVDPIRHEVQALDRSLPVFEVSTMDATIRADLAQRRFYLTLIGGFALLALVLSAVGIYGVMAYSVGLRTHEMGIRMALGAPRAGILRLVLGQGMALVGVGLALGVPAALGASRLVASMLYGVGSSDAATFGGMAGVLVTAALLACLVPARRATRIDPIRALRND